LEAREPSSCRKICDFGMLACMSCAPGTVSRRACQNRQVSPQLAGLPLVGCLASPLALVLIAHLLRTPVSLRLAKTNSAHKPGSLVLDSNLSFSPSPRVAVPLKTHIPTAQAGTGHAHHLHVACRICFGEARQSDPQVGFANRRERVARSLPF
jgi:hypothetical protein